MMGYFFIRFWVKYCFSDFYMYEVGYGLVEVSEEIQVFMVYILVYILIIIDSIRYILNFFVIRKLYKYIGELSYFRILVGENFLKLIFFNLLDCF